MNTGNRTGLKMTNYAKGEREIVLDILMDREKKGTYSNVLVRKALDRYAGIPQTQRSFIKRLAEGTIERQIELDGIIKSHLRNKDDPIRPIVLCLLRMSVYQLSYMDSVPDFAVCNEAVRILKKRHQDSAVAFVNAVLRSICRDKKENSDKPDNELTLEQLCVRYSMPEVIASLWKEAYGEQKVRSLLPAMMAPRPVCIRMDRRRSEEERGEVLKRFREKGVEVTPGHYVPDCYYLKGASGIASLYGFAEGIFTVQDESSQLAVLAAGLTGSEIVFDLCAAPGGKTLFAESLLPSGRVYAYDVSPVKTAQIKSNISRIDGGHFPCRVTVGVKDATAFDPALENRADVVLCDVPCSGLGVMTKKRDIKYNVSMEKITSLVTLQKKILRNAVRYVKPGGTLIYSTCTLNPWENDLQAEFIRTKLSMQPEDLSGYLPSGVPGINGNMLQLFPDVHDTDGFFIARFKKPL